MSKRIKEIKARADDVRRSDDFGHSTQDCLEWESQHLPKVQDDCLFLLAELKKRDDKILEFRQSMSFNGQRTKSKIDSLEAKIDSLEAKLARRERQVEVYEKQVNLCLRIRPDEIMTRWQVPSTIDCMHRNFVMGLKECASEALAKGRTIMEDK